jgi:hypothetical protein
MSNERNYKFFFIECYRSSMGHDRRADSWNYNYQSEWWYEFLFVNGILFSQGGHERCAPLSYMVDIWGVLYMISRIPCYCLFIWFCNILLIVLDLLVKYPAGPTKYPTSQDSAAQRIGGNLIRRRAPGSRTRVPPLRVGRPWRLSWQPKRQKNTFQEMRR